MVAGRSGPDGAHARFPVTMAKLSVKEIATTQSRILGANIAQAKEPMLKIALLEKDVQVSSFLLSFQSSVASKIHSCHPYFLIFTQTVSIIFEDCV